MCLSRQREQWPICCAILDISRWSLELFVRVGFSNIFGDYNGAADYLAKLGFDFGDDVFFFFFFAKKRNEKVRFNFSPYLIFQSFSAD